jgi:hypothetical protein
MEVKVGIIDNAKDIAELIKKMGNMELYEKIVGLQGQIFSLREENLKQKEQINNLKDQICTKQKVSYEAPYYWIIGKNGQKDGPFCQKCYDTDKVLVRLQDLKRGTWKCLSCESLVRDASYSPPKSKQGLF